MELDNKKQILYFDTDQEFTDFALAPHAVIKEVSQGVLAYGGEHSGEYKKCIAEGKVFVIREKDSKVCRRMCVEKRLPVYYNGTSLGRDALVQLPVQNVEEALDSFPFSK